VNYYEHHIGDYAEATAHLSFVEDAAYSRLIRKYYASEKALPAEIKSVQRLIAARTRDEKEAVQTILEEFFELRDDGWHNTRCDEEIGRFQHKQAMAKRSADARWNKPKPQSEGNANASPDAMRTHSEGNAHQSPVASRQSPDVNPTNHSVSCTQPVASTRKGAVCGMLRQAGMSDAAPHYLDEPTWDAILSKRTDEEIVEVAKAKMAARPGQRTGLKYIAPALMEDPQPIHFNAPRQATGRQAAIDNYAAEAAAARGETHDRKPASERDITGESVRVA
jgi:uncharacterized protein YdaU (DUF1376 family)